MSPPACGADPRSCEQGRHQVSAMAATTPCGKCQKMLYVMFKVTLGLQLPLRAAAGQSGCVIRATDCVSCRSIGSTQSCTLAQ